MLFSARAIVTLGPYTHMRDATCTPIQEVNVKDSDRDKRYVHCKNNALCYNSTYGRRKRVKKTLNDKGRNH
jgi:hypothetical protein